MPRPPHSRSTKLSAEERRLQREQQELLRREEELQRELRTLPARIEERKVRERQYAKLRAEAAAPAISLGGGRSTRGSRPAHREKRLRGRELQNARIKFLVLCLILASLVIMLWRAIPA